MAAQIVPSATSKAAQQRKLLTTHKDREATFAESQPDYYDKAYTAPINYSPAMLDFISTSDKGPEIAYYLADHLDEAKAIEAQPPNLSIVVQRSAERNHGYHFCSGVEMNTTTALRPNMDATIHFTMNC